LALALAGSSAADDLLPLTTTKVASLLPCTAPCTHRT
jgi:hypothetical protein